MPAACLLQPSAAAWNSHTLDTADWAQPQTAGDSVETQSVGLGTQPAD